MKLLSVFRKTWRELARDPLTLSLSVVFAPIFVLLYWLLFPSGSTTYEVLVLNRDTGPAGQGIVSALEAVTYADGRPILRPREVLDRAAAEARLRDRKSLVLLVIPPDFSASLQAAARGEVVEGEAVTFVGDLTNPYYPIAGFLAQAALDDYLGVLTGRGRPVPVAEEPLGGSGARTEFESYVPGLLVFAVVMLIFLAAMTAAREAEAGTLRRLQLTRMSSFDFLGGISLALTLVGVTQVLLTFATARMLGFRSASPLWVAVLVGALTSLAVIGAGLLVACLSRSVSQAFVIANFPLALFMFFSGSIFPVPPIPLFTLDGRTMALFDILPPTHAVAALNKIFTLGAGIEEVRYELAALAVLSAFYFGLGLWLFRRRQVVT